MNLRTFLRDTRGAGAAEFALVLPLLILLLFGVIDVGRWIWAYNQAEKATQIGARMAVVTDYLSSSVGSSYIAVTCGGTTLTQGDRIPASCLSNITCNSGGCNPGGSVANYAAKFQGQNSVYEKMRRFLLPTTVLQPSNVTIEYTQSGLGYAGDPWGPDVSPIVTVQLQGLQFRPLITLAMVAVPMPEFHTSLTQEDAIGAQSN